MLPSDSELRYAIQMKKIPIVLLGLLLVGTVAAQSGNVDPLHHAFATDRVEAFARALENRDGLVAFRLLEPSHLRMNAVYYDAFALDNPKTVDFAICNWGIMAESGSPFLQSIAEIKSVDTTFIDTFDDVWRVYLEVTLVDGTDGTYSLFMDPETLLMFGASG